MIQIRPQTMHIPHKYCTCTGTQTHTRIYHMQSHSCSTFLNQSPGHDPIFPSSTYCVAFHRSAYCFLWLIFLLAFPAALVWVSRLPVGFQNNSSCQPSFLPSPLFPCSSLVFYSSLHSPFYSIFLSPSSIRFSRSIWERGEVGLTQSCSRHNPPITSASSIVKSW